MERTALTGTFLDHALGYSTTQPQLFPKLLESSEIAAEEGKYFHWELEFPDVFFGPNGDSLGSMGGFNVVIVNTSRPLRPRLAEYRVPGGVWGENQSMT